MSDTRTIKKYPNRRLYDTELSQYITLADIRKYVLEGVAFTVIDVKSEEDITPSILLQIIAEQELEGGSMFSTELLSQIIRFYGQSVQSMAAEYMERSMALFASQQQRLQEAMSSQNPLQVMSDMTKQNLQLWKDMQESFFKVRPDADAESRETSGDSRQDK